MNLLTKTNSLKVIKKHNKNIVPKFIYFDKITFLKKKKESINKITRNFTDDIIIRSSAINEDSKSKSNAGFYDSHFISKKKVSPQTLRRCQLVVTTRHVGSLLI